MSKSTFAVIFILINLYITTSQATTLVTLSSGSKKGLYYPVSGLLCRMINKVNSEHELRCSVLPSQGSIANIHDLKNNKVQFALVQSNVQFNAYNGIGNFAQSGAFKNLRSLFSLHSESFTLVAQKGAGINEVKDIRGKRINLGAKGSGEREMLDKLIQLNKWQRGNFKRVFELNADEQSKALCSNLIEVMVITAGHPNKLLQETAKACDIVFIDIDEKSVNKLIEQNPFYEKTRIPQSLYPKLEKDTDSIGVTATLVTSSEVPEDVVYNFTKAVFEQKDKLKAFHPAFSHLQLSEMVKKGLSAPLHPGAERYFQEIGLGEFISKTD